MKVSSSGSSPSSPPPSERTALHKVRFGGGPDQAQFQALIKAVEVLVPKSANPKGFLGTLNHWAGKISSVVTPISSLVGPATTLFNTFVSHNFTMKRVERSAEITKEVQKIQHEQRTQQNYQIAGSAAAVLGLGIVGVAKAGAWLNAKRMAQQLEGTYQHIAQKDIHDSHFDNLIGHRNLKAVLEGDVLGRIQNPEFFPKDSDPKIVLYGPPGTGKTFAVKCLANKALQDGMPVEVLSLNAANLFSNPGIGVKIMDKIQSDIQNLGGRKVFLILDEADSLGSRDSVHASEETKRNVNTILQKLDGFNSLKHVNLFAMTNHPKSLDNAFLSRARHKIPVSAPNTDDLDQIFNHYLQHTKTLEYGDSLKLIPPNNLNMLKILAASQGFTGRDVKNTMDNLIDRVILQNLDRLKAQRASVLSQHVPPPPTLMDKINSLFVAPCPPPPPVINYQIPFTEAQLLAAIKQVQGDGIHKAADAVQPGKTISAPGNPFEVSHPADLGGKGFTSPNKGLDASYRLCGANGVQTVLPGAAPAA